MKIVKKSYTENCPFNSREQSLYIALACFRNGTTKTDLIGFSHIRRKRYPCLRLQCTCRKELGSVGRKVFLLILCFNFHFFKTDSKYLLELKII